MSAGANRIEFTTPSQSAINLCKVGAWRGIRVLAWSGDVLYASRGYQLLCLYTRDLQAKNQAQWKAVGNFNPVWWRNLTSRNKLTHRLFRDGFHALAILEDQTMIAAVPGAIVQRNRADNEFRITFQIQRGTRPLHIAAVPSGRIYWGEYFDNRKHAEVHIYASTDYGRTWNVAYTFPAGAIRHVHNIVYDRWANCLWILTGDEGQECKVLRASCDLRTVDMVLCGNQQARAVAAISTHDALFLSTDTPFEQNHVLRLDRDGCVEPVAELESSSIFGCRTASAYFFSTMVEPSVVNRSREVHLVGSANGLNWEVLAHWEKDRLPMRYFQYGNIFLPDGENTTNFLAATTIAVKQDNLVTTLWLVDTNGSAMANTNKTQTSSP